MSPSIKTDLLTVDGVRTLNEALERGEIHGIQADFWWKRLYAAMRTKREQAHLYPRWPAELGAEMDRAVDLFWAKCGI